MRKVLISVTLLISGLVLYAQDYKCEWLAMGSTDDMSTSQVVTWRTAPESVCAIAQIAPATWSPNIEPLAKEVKVESAVKTDYNVTMCYHKATFKDLEPSTEYVYRLGDGNGKWSEWFTFKTAGAKTDSFKFIYMADVQSGIMNQYPRVIRKAYAQAPDASFILFTGDLTERALNEQYNDFFTAHGWIFSQMPMVAVPDNHEYPFGPSGTREKLCTYWDHMFSHPHNSPEPLDAKGFFCLDYQNCRFVMVNTREIDDYTPEVKQMTFEWIEKCLAENPCKWLVVAQHRPVYSVADKRKSNKDMYVLQALYEKYHVDLVISGHDHVYSRTATKDGRKSVTPVCVSSVGGSGQYAPGYYKVHDRIGSNCEFFQVISVTEKSILFESYDCLGTLYDSFRIDYKKGQNKFVDLTPSVKMRTDLPPTRRHKYTDEEWKKLDDLRQQFNTNRNIK